MELSGVLESERTARKRAAWCKMPRSWFCFFAGLCLTVGCHSLNHSGQMADLSMASDPPSQASLPAANETNDTTLDTTVRPTVDVAAEVASSAVSTTSAASPAEEAFSTENEVTATFRADDVEAILAKPEGWIGTPAPKRETIAWNWYHPRIEEVLAWPEENEPVLRAALKKKDPVTATNAAICLARLGDDSGVPILISAVRSGRLETPLRVTAAEALASFDSSVATVQKLIDEYDDQAKTPNMALYRELIAGLGNHIDPAGDRRFLAAMNSRDADVRLAAIEAWAKSPSAVLPNELVYLAADPSEKNRIAVMHALGTHDHPERMNYLSSGLRDINYLVRVAAIESLGQIASPEAIGWLEEATKSSSMIVRAAAVRSLATAGRLDLALQSSGDTAWQVRLAVAEVLPKDPDLKSVEVAKGLLEDRSPEVQRQVLLSIDAWPIAKSGPLLFDAMEKFGFQIRQVATDQLGKQWEPARRFPRHAPGEVRQRAMVQLRTEFQQEYGHLMDARFKNADGKEKSQNPAPVDPQLVARVKRLIAKHEDPRCASADRYQLRQEILNLGPDSMAVLEHLVFEKGEELPEAFYTTVLPELDPTFDILYQMQAKTTESEKPLSRRRAASNLIRLTAEREPSRLALDRLAEQMLQETDTLVWRSVLIALANNESDSTLQMVRIAVGHTSPEIRRRACQWLAAHPRPDDFKLLKPALDDPDPSVKLAAVRAVVAGGNLGDTKEVEPLKELLRDSNEELRIEVAYALAAFGDEQGPQTLKELTRSRDANVRQKAVEAIGQLEDPRYASLLISLLDDQLNVRRAALGALPKTVGHDVPAAGDHQPRTASEIIARWKEWHANTMGNDFSLKSANQTSSKLDR